jgi:hypothetical protein
VVLASSASGAARDPSLLVIYPIRSATPSRIRESPT